MSTLEQFFTIKNGSLFFDEISLENDVAKKYGTPTYVFSKRIIQKNISELKDAFQKYYPNTEIAYSTKNNLNYDLISLIAEEVNYFETTSLLELLLVQKLANEKNKPLNLISTNLYKPEGLIQQMIENENLGNKNCVKGIIAIDSFQDMKNIERVAKKLNKKARVIVRVNPGTQMSRDSTVFASAYPDAKCSLIIYDIDSIISESNESRIDEWLLERNYKPEYDFAERIIEEVEESKYLDLVGIHGHIGSQVTNIEYFNHFFEVITIFYKLIEEKLGRKLDILDLGGGYPVKYSPDVEIPSIDEIAKLLIEKITKAKINPLLIIESGRFVTASSGVLLSEITLTKENLSGGRIGVLDLSVYSDLLDVIVAKWHYESRLVNNIPNENEVLETANWELVGSTNDTLDQIDPISKFQFKRFFPRDLKSGDLIAILNAGAYTTCFNSNYCGKPKPMIVLIDHQSKQKIKLLKRSY
ncbi:MAG TPA: hypothetical protein VMX55_01775 [candidate division Zixibacteria bacterium]|nr:hypothetical protein [candidate division Zixibacteria bacterium]